jgi:hypothetical protein
MRDARDASLTKAFHDVAVPEGLAERLLASLAADNGTDASSQVNSGADIPACQVPPGFSGRQECLPHRLSGKEECPSHRFSGRQECVPHRPSGGLRRWLAVVGGLASAAAIVLAVWLGGTSRVVTAESAREQAMRLFCERTDQIGHLRAREDAPSEYRFSSYVRSLRGTRWRRLNDFLGCSGVVYELPGPTGTDAVLYVVACKNTKGLGQSPESPRDAIMTSGCCASAWQENGLLYVLVVKGNQSNYQQYLELPSSPVV